MIRAENLFKLSTRAVQSLTGKQRALLSLKIGQYLSRKRRGRLNLPDGFPPSVAKLADMTRGQVSEWAYYYNGSMSARGLVTPVTSGYLHRVAPGKIWTRTTASVCEGQSEVVKRLPRKHEPRISGTVWPSTPDIFEILEMSRRGIVSPAQDKAPITVKDCINRRAVSDDIRLATALVRQQIVGVRRSIEVPRKFLGHFRTCHDFLILTGRYSIPAGLVRFLIAQWVVTPTSLWLVSNCSFKCYLKRTRSADLISHAAFASRVKNPVGEGSAGSTKRDDDPVDNWSIYTPRLHLFQEALVKQCITEKGWWPPLSMTMVGTPSAVRTFR